MWMTFKIYDIHLVQRCISGKTFVKILWWDSEKFCFHYYRTGCTIKDEYRFWVLFRESAEMHASVLEVEKNEFNIPIIKTWYTEVLFQSTCCSALKCGLLQSVVHATCYTQRRPRLRRCFSLARAADHQRSSARLVLPSLSSRRWWQ